MQQIKRVLVTGGAGFIGSHSVDLLLQQGFEVRVLDNLSAGKRSNLPLSNPNLELCIGDVTCFEDVEAAMQGVDACLHLAAQVSVVLSIQDPVFSCQQNILGFTCVMHAAVKHGVQRLVYASSAAIYGQPASLPIDESALLAPISPYGLEKSVNEQYAALANGLHSLSSLGLRYFNVYGPRQDPASSYAGVISIFMQRIREKKSVTIYGDGSQNRDFIFVGDVARANVAALLSNSTGVCNVATGHSITLLELVDIIGSFTGHVDIQFAKARHGDICLSAASVEKMHEMLEISAETQPAQGLRQLWDVLQRG
ncbi:MAG: NAD-dependent epimerase/dehydratase family protein [Mariprofundaceae bacterium]|nr:NAD-dependent epimerase/dehydratase family protein [Mariprofundaceae bacterium]